MIIDNAMIECGFRAKTYEPINLNSQKRLAYLSSLLSIYRRIKSFFSTFSMRSFYLSPWLVCVSCLTVVDVVAAALIFTDLAVDRKTAFETSYKIFNIEQYLL